MEQQVKVTAYVTRERNGQRQLLVMMESELKILDWQVPGGTVEAGERPEQALLRELEEEAGLTDVQIVAELPPCSYVRDGRPIKRHFFHVTCEALPDAFEHTVTGQGDDNGWVYRYQWIDLLPGQPLPLFHWLGARLEHLGVAPDTRPWLTGILLERHAREICAWSYEAPYDIYSFGSYENAVRHGESIADATKRLTHFFGVFSEPGELMGFVELVETEGTIVIGLGLRPDLCSRGLGPALTTEAVRAAGRIAKGRKITLEVRRFNKRAITCYERSGFVIVEEYERRTPSGIGDFYRMEYREAAASAEATGA